MQLGQLDIPKKNWKLLAKMLERKLSGQEVLFGQENSELVQVAEHAMEKFKFLKARQKDVDQRHDQRELESIDINSLNVSKARSLGPVLVGNEYWGRLGFDSILRKCGFNERQRSLSKAVVLGRLVAPGSELASWRWFRDNTALPELLDADISDIGKDPFYEISDALLPHKDQIESALWRKQQSLFNYKPTIFLYDLTNTYFEGMCNANPLAQHGKSKEKRYDCRLVSLALVVDEYGTPVFSRIYRGNQSEPETLNQVLNHVYDPDRLDGNIKPTIIMDRGIATKENLQIIRKMGLPYAVVDGKNMRKSTLSS
jgi:hypothetical protein